MVLALAVTRSPDCSGNQRRRKATAAPDREIESPRRPDGGANFRLPLVLEFLSPGQRLIHDRDTKFSAEFAATLQAAGVGTIKLPAHSPIGR